MTNPKTAVIPGYATEAEAYGMWAQIKNNDKLAVVAVNIGLGTFKPAQKSVCYVILPANISFDLNTMTLKT